MSDEEFGSQAADVGAQLASFDRRDRIAAASRGSANPAALAWLAEGLRLGHNSRIVDLGSGLGGPAAWLTDRYRCEVVCVEPQHAAARSAADLFGLTTIVASADAVPLHDGAFDAVLLLGVLSTLDDRRAALLESARLAGRLGVLEYCATSGCRVEAGGSTFPTEQELLDELRAAGWRPDQRTPMSMPAPATWSDAADRVDSRPDASEAEVLAAIEAGRIAPQLVVASR